VTDQGNREISGTGWALATVGSFLVNIEPEQYVYQSGDLARLRVQARDYDGHPVETDFKVEMGEGCGGKSEEFTRSFTAQGHTDSQGAATVQAPLAKAGCWVAQVTASTPERRTVRERTHLWVSGGAVWDGERQERLQMIPDKRSYKVGETARVLILTGVPDAHILVATEGREIHTVRTVEAHGPTVTVEVPILPAYAPNFFLNAAFLRGNQYYEGSKSIRVPAIDRQLKVAVTPSKKQFRPGEPGDYTIEASDSAGRPVAAEFSLGVVDEAIYAIHRESVKDIASYFYGSIYNLVNTSSSLAYYFQGEAGKRKMLLAQLRSPALAQIKPERLVMPKVRKAFPDTALWLANVTTDASGHARAHLTFPDALTTWRATARGVTRDTKVGSAVQKTIVRKNLILSLAVPRLLS
jgi:hypothetical protein